MTDCPDEDFNRQLGYKSVEPKYMPRGPRLVCTTHDDSSADIFNHSDPNRWVMRGEQN